MIQTHDNSADVGLIGLGVMGKNLVLNLADHGYRVAVYNRTTAVTHEFIEQYSTQHQSLAASAKGIAPPSPSGRGVGGEGGSGPSNQIREDPHPSPLPGGEGTGEARKSGGLVGCETLEQFVASIKPPRVMIVLVKAGPAVDAVCEQLIKAGAQPNDIVVDGGNSLWTDTIRREKDYRGKLTFFGSGVSGGEVGARYGPSLMPGGDERAWETLKPIWEAIAAKVDSRSGKPLEGATNTKGQPCTTYLGPDGAGHYVKMVHNGIEYADMQLIAEAYHLLRTTLPLAPKQLGEVFSRWNEGELASYLIEVTADILRQDDPITGKPLVDVILDKAGMKGTGTWTAINALELGVPSVSITEAVFARGMSSLKDERVAASSILASPTKEPSPNPLPEGEGFTEAVRDALYCSKICAYAQGFQLMAAAQVQYNWKLNFGEIARIWRGGCIIRAAFLQKITDAYERDSNLANLLLDSFFREEIAKRQAAWRQVVSHAALNGIPTPAFSSALAYYDGYRSATLPANLIQAQRDYFGAHTYERVDQPRGKFFHLNWTDPNRPQLES